MRRELERQYEDFLTAERDKYKEGHVTKEERASFERELEQLRSFSIPGHIGPNTTYRGE